MGGGGALDGVAIVGATGTGKTALSLALAERLEAEILCCDSRQIYRGLDVATGKPTRLEQSVAPHHLFDLLPPNERSSAGTYARHAAPVLAAVQGRGRLPIVVGGTGFYLEALRFGLPEIPTIPDTVVQGLETEWRERGGEALRAELAAADPRAAAKLPAGDRRRIVRALAVWRATRRPFSAWLAHHVGATVSPRRRLLVFTIELPRRELHGRLDDRTRRFFEIGLLEEVQTLLAAGCPPDAPALSGLGYGEAVRAIRGEIDAASALERTQRATRQYAKRQDTWFRGRGARGGVTVLAMSDHTIESAADWMTAHLRQVRGTLP